MDMVMMRGLEYTAVVYSVKPRVRSRRKSPWNFKTRSTALADHDVFPPLLC